MTLKIESDPTPAPPTIRNEVIDLGQAREVRQLRAQVEQLTAQLVETKDARIKPTLIARMGYEEEHRKCGLYPPVVISSETDEVECQTCGVRLSPLDVLREYANRERFFISGLEHLREEKKKLSIEIDKLKSQRSSLRSQVRKKGGEVPADPNATKPTIQQYYKLATELHAARLEIETLKAAAK